MFAQNFSMTLGYSKFQLRGWKLKMSFCPRNEKGVCVAADIAVLVEKVVFFATFANLVF